MYTGIYDFSLANAVKILIENQDGKILLVQEPENFEWMPLHWGLPGGKATKTESLLETLDRKIKGDIGHEININGIVSIEEILMKERTVQMFIVSAKTDSNNIQGDVKVYKWVTKEDVEKMNRENFTEFYNKRLLLDYFNNKLPKPIPLSIIHTGEHYKLENDPEYKKWFESGSKKN